MKRALIVAILNSSIMVVLTHSGLGQEIEPARVEGHVGSYVQGEYFQAAVRFWFLEPLASGVSTERRLKLVREVKSDSSNRYHAEGLTPGDYLIECFVPYIGSDWTWRELDSPGGVPVVVDFLRLKGLTPDDGPPWKLGGKVLLPDGSPATRATVTLTNPYNPSDAVQVHTDENGGFTFVIGRTVLTFYSIVHAFDDTHKPAAVVANRDELTERSVVLKLGEY